MLPWEGIALQSTLKCLCARQGHLPVPIQLARVTLQGWKLNFDSTRYWASEFKKCTKKCAVCTCPRRFDTRLDECHPCPLASFLRINGYPRATLLGRLSFLLGGLFLLTWKPTEMVARASRAKDKNTKFAAITLLLAVMFVLLCSIKCIIAKNNNNNVRMYKSPPKEESLQPCQNVL